MPCTNDCGDDRCSVRIVNNPEHIKKIDLLTRLLCHACDVIEEIGGDLNDANQELKDWHEEHERQDAARIAEANRQLAKRKNKILRAKYLKSVRERTLKQLTDDEREALGLK